MSSRRLVKGDVRFILLFEDRELAIPIIQTMVYERSEKHNGISKRHFFRDVSSQKKELFFVDEEEFDDLILDIRGLYRKIGQIF